MSKKNLRPTAGNLKKLEQLLENLGYKIIYEKGTFQSGYCLVNARKMIVMNKFYKTDMRVNNLLKILAELQPASDQFEEEQQVFFNSLPISAHVGD
ncbi:MAG: hypothetical protein AB8E82_00815 [Aureispira sp.]